MKKRPKVALVLGGGGALGFAHIGVIDELQKNNIPIDMIVGTSIGSIVGGAVATGSSVEDLKNFAKGLKTRHLYDLNLNLKGLLSGRSVIRVLKKFLPDIDMKETKIPFVCNAVDLKTCKEVVLTDGPLIKNIRASISCPGVFTPVKYGNMLLVDGGVVNNLAHDIARKMGADIIIAVDVVTKTELNTQIKGVVGYVIQSWLIAQKELQANKRKYYNVLIQPELGTNNQYNFNGEVTEKIIQLGADACKEKIGRIKELITDFNG